MPVTIPTRSSSKRTLEDTIAEDTQLRNTVTSEITKQRKKLKPYGSFDGKYWSSHQSILELDLERQILHRKISRNSFFSKTGTFEGWDELSDTRDLIEAESKIESKQRVLHDYLQRKKLNEASMDEAEKDAAHQLEMKIKLMMFVPAKNGGVGLSGIAGEGERPSSEQTRFRKALEQACKSAHPDKFVEKHWCPVLGCYIPSGFVVAAHIFPYGAGQFLMDDLFGRPDEERPELFSPSNGLILSTPVEKMIAQGYLALVPDLSDDATSDQVQAWTALDGKPFKIHIFRRDLKEMKFELPFISAVNESKGIRTWGQLHNCRVEFLSNHRPRSRYLYWLWAVGLIRTAWQVNHKIDNPISKELNKQYWGTGGKWIKKKILLGFAQYVGHKGDWTAQLPNAFEDPEDVDNDTPDPTGVALAMTRPRDERSRITSRTFKCFERDDQACEGGSDSKVL